MTCLNWTVFFVNIKVREYFSLQTYYTNCISLKQYLSNRFLKYQIIFSFSISDVICLLESTTSSSMEVWPIYWVLIVPNDFKQQFFFLSWWNPNISLQMGHFFSMSRYGWFETPTTSSFNNCLLYSSKRKRKK